MPRSQRPFRMWAHTADMVKTSCATPQGARVFRQSVRFPCQVVF